MIHKLKKERGVRKSGAGSFDFASSVRRAFALLMVFLVVACSSDNALDSVSNDKPNPPAIPSGDDLRVIGYPLELSSFATDPERDSISLTFHWGDGAESSTALGASGDTLSAAHSYSTLGSYRVYVTATDQSGNLSDSSDRLRVAIVEPGPTRPTAPLGPDTISLGEICFFTSQARDPFGDSLRLIFQWGDTDSSATPFLADGNVFSAGHAYYDSGAYEVTVYAVDGEGRVSVYSAPATVNIANRAPSKPVAPFGDSMALVRETITMFSRSTDPEGDPFYMTFYWGDATSINTLIQSGNEVFSASHFYTDTGLYIVAVVVTDIFGNESEKSESTFISIPAFPVVRVVIANKILSPTSVNINRGYGVNFVNLDELSKIEGHQFVSDTPGVFSADLLLFSDSSVVYFPEVGLYNFHCSEHPGAGAEKGLISVSP